MEGTYHDIMRQALSQLAAATISPERNRTEEHLRPANDWVRLADDAVSADGPRTDGFFVYVQFEIYAECKLEENRDEEYVRHDAMDAGKEGAAAVGMAQDVPANRESNACALT